MSDFFNGIAWIAILPWQCYVVVGVAAVVGFLLPGWVLDREERRMKHNSTPGVMAAETQQGGNDGR